MVNKGMFMLSDDNYQEWKENMNYRLMNPGSDVWTLVCHGCSKTSPSSEELHKNSVDLNEIFGNITNSGLRNSMHY